MTQLPPLSENTASAKSTALKEAEILCLGNAIVDIVAQVDDAFLTAHDRVKGSMMLVDEAMSAKIYQAMPPASEHSGGSAANTAVGIASFGGKARYVGKVRDDQLGAVFRHDIQAAGVVFESEALREGEATASSMILVTPDAQRTMNTYLGACGALGPDDVRPAEIGAADITYIEGYLWDRPKAKEAVLKAIDLAHQQGRRVALTLSDSFCVERFRGEFQDLVATKVDLLFANEAELKALYQFDDFEAALAKLAGFGKLAAVTRSEKGSVVLKAGVRVDIPAYAATILDTTGAGDLYAAGFLYGYAAGLDIGLAGHLGSLAASEVIGHLGARPAQSLRGLAQTKGLL